MSDPSPRRLCGRRNGRCTLKTFRFSFEGGRIAAMFSGPPWATTLPHCAATSPLYPDVRYTPVDCRRVDIDEKFALGGRLLVLRRFCASAGPHDLGNRDTAGGRRATASLRISAIKSLRTNPPDLDLRPSNQLAPS
jgi:hypothetical protein